MMTDTIRHHSWHHSHGDNNIGVKNYTRKQPSHKSKDYITKTANENRSDYALKIYNNKTKKQKPMIDNPVINKSQ